MTRVWIIKCYKKGTLVEIVNHSFPLCSDALWYIDHSHVTKMQRAAGMTHVAVKLSHLSVGSVQQLWPASNSQTATL